VQKGRGAAGARNGRAKITEQQANDIRRLYELGGISQAKLGKCYGISKRQVGRIANGKQWA